MLLSCSHGLALGGTTVSVPDKPILKPGGGASRNSFYGSSLVVGQFQHQPQLRRNLVVASLKPPSKGFGKKSVVEKKSESPSPQVLSESSKSASQEDAPTKFQYRREVVDDDEEVPEVVTNRMLKRIGITVGVPVGLGLLLFPAFYYLKIVQRVDVPEWLPLVVSMVTFGTAGFGITYGIVSTSWDPAREGSLLGWKEAQVNWPLIWDKVQGNSKKK
jgi:hypothetical protein